MINRLIKNKTTLMAVIALGVFLFSMGPAMASVHHMGSMDCPTQILCGACSVPVISDPNQVDHFFHILEMLTDPAELLAEQHTLPFYHPPR